MISFAGGGMPVDPNSLAMGPYQVPQTNGYDPRAIRPGERNAITGLMGSNSSPNTFGPMAEQQIGMRYNDPTWRHPITGQQGGTFQQMAAPQGWGQTPVGYTNPTGANGYPPGYDATNAPGWDPVTQSPRGQPSGQTQYGYGTAPGQSNRGYFEQMTPIGSFAAAESRSAGPAAQASNPYLGMSSQVGGGSAGQATAASNPYFGQSNPYTAQAVNAASEAATRNYNLAIAPQRDTQMARSGSFGNTGIQQMQLEDQRNLQNTLGNIANNAYMQDLANQQQMGESSANRQTGTSQFNVGARAGDLNRQLGSTQFDAGLAQGLSTFNAGQNNQMAMFDAGQANNTNMFNAGQGNNFLQFAQNLDANIDQNNWNRQRTGTMDQLNILSTLAGLNQTGIGNATNLNNAGLSQWAQIANVINSIAGQGGVNTQNLQGNPWLSGLGGLLAGTNLWNSWSNP